MLIFWKRLKLKVRYLLEKRDNPIMKIESDHLLRNRVNRELKKIVVKKGMRFLFCKENVIFREKFIHVGYLKCWT